MRRTLREFVEQVLFDFVGEDEEDIDPKTKKDLLIEPDWSKDDKEDPANEISTTAGVAGYTSPAAFDFSQFSVGPGPQDHLKRSGSRRKK